MKFHIVTGAPCAGKTTYIKDHKCEGDAVIDFDAIAVALGADRPHECSSLVLEMAKYARKAALDTAISESRKNKQVGDVWIAHALPSDDHRRYYNRLDVVWHELDTPKDVCLSRAKADSRPKRSIRGIETYFSKKDSGQGLTLSEMER